MVCKKMGWTINELYRQPAEKVNMFMSIMDIEGQFKNRK